MSSTRNNNTINNYNVQQYIYNKTKNYILSPHLLVNNYNLPDSTQPNRSINPNALSNNYIDIESNLKGIGSSNFISPKKFSAPNYKNIGNFKFYDRIELINANQIKQNLNQRPLLS